ncbi:ubiquitin-like protein [Streptomyces sp. NPDC051546]|uniref:ubiquitin-like protein n=1 Tax=Streptomyces sp. NPDC051546 TaxID=3365655 RepID=UPI0037B29998
MTDGAVINVKVVDQDGTEVHYKVRRTSTLAGLMHGHAQRLGTSATSVRFLFDGVRLRSSDTPESAELEEGSAIDALIEVVA